MRVRARVRQTEHGPVLQPAHEETRQKARALFRAAEEAVRFAAEGGRR